MLQHDAALDSRAEARPTQLAKKPCFPPPFGEAAHPQPFQGEPRGESPPARCPKPTRRNAGASSAGFILSVPAFQMHEMTLIRFPMLSMMLRSGPSDAGAAALWITRRTRYSRMWITRLI
jgi:hypothetical protein